MLLSQEIYQKIDKINKKNIFYCPFCKRLVVSPKNIIVDINLCPICASMERHRVLYFLLTQICKSHFNNLNNSECNVLHVAPENSLYNLFKNFNCNYVPVDIEPDNFPFIKNTKVLKENVLAFTFGDNIFDLILHNHVIEHVEDDLLFIKECLRILRHGGKMILTLPFYPAQKSNFDKSIISEEDRKRYFGWHDHLRLYGYDFMEYFNLNNLYPKILFRSDKPEDCFLKNDIKAMQLAANEPWDAILLFEKK